MYRRLGTTRSITGMLFRPLQSSEGWCRFHIPRCRFRCNRSYCPFSSLLVKHVLSSYTPSQLVIWLLISPGTLTLTSRVTRYTHSHLFAPRIHPPGRQTSIGYFPGVLAIRYYTAHRFPHRWSAEYCLLEEATQCVRRVVWEQQHIWK